MEVYSVDGRKFLRKDDSSLSVSEKLFYEVVISVTVSQVIWYNISLIIGCVLKAGLEFDVAKHSTSN